MDELGLCWGLIGPVRRPMNWYRIHLCDAAACQSSCQNVRLTVDVGDVVTTQTPAQLLFGWARDLFEIRDKTASDTVYPTPRSPYTGVNNIICVRMTYM
jgi:hypothetical protein